MEAQDILVLAIVAACAVLVLRKLLRPLIQSKRAEDPCGGCSSRCDSKLQKSSETAPNKPHPN